MDLKESLGLILFNVIMYPLDRSSKLKSNVVSQDHINKLSKLRNQIKLASPENPLIFICQRLHNFPSYHLTIEEEKPLSFGLNEHIPTGLNGSIKFFLSLKYFIKRF